MSTKKETQKSKGFTDEEKAAMKERAKELKAEERANKDRAAGEKDLLAKIAEMPEPERAMAKRLHEIVKASASELMPKTWYGCPPMPTRTAKSSASSKVRRSSTQGMRRLASVTQRTSTKGTCGRPPSR